VTICLRYGAGRVPVVAALPYIVSMISYAVSGRSGRAAAAAPSLAAASFIAASMSSRLAYLCSYIETAWFR